MEFAIVSDWKRHPCEEAQLEEIFAKEFARRGHTIHWVAFIPDLETSERRERWHGHPITLFRRDASMAYRLWRWLTRLLNERQIDFIQVRNDPFLAMIAATFARRAQTPFVYHLSILNGPLIREESHEARGLRRARMWLKGTIGGMLVDRVAKSCDLLLPISDAMAEHFTVRGRRGPSFALPMGCRDAAFDAVREPDGLIEVLYIGSLNRVRRLDFLLRAFAQAHSMDSRLRLAFLGSGRPGDLPRLANDVRALGLEDTVRIEEPVPREAVGRRIARCDIGVSPIPPTPYYQLSSPTKLMECLGRGRPVVANDIPEQRAILGASSAGICVKYDESAFAAAIVALASDPTRRREAGQRGVEYMACYRDYSVLAEQLENAYAQFIVKYGRSWKLQNP
jgi:glycosyltransferase involved in cell wall biosynthesis